MVTDAMQYEPQGEKGDQRMNIYGMMSDAAKVESNACKNVAMGAMRILSLQADETEAQLQNKDLSDSDRSKFFDERAAIRHDAIQLTNTYHDNSVLEVLGIASIFAMFLGVGYGAGRYMLRTV